MDKEKQKCKELLEDNLNMLKNMSVPEYTLYRKWVEVNDLYQKNESLMDMLFETEEDFLPKEEQAVKNNIWIPNSYEDYLNIEPEVVYVGDKNASKIWNTLRVFCSRMPWNQNPGRLLRFYVIDKHTRKYLGLFSLGSDFIGIGGRDKYIGWTTDHRLKDKMLNYTAMGSTIVSTQPLGYNYLGGKFMSLLVCSDAVEKTWNKKYKEPLVGITTTSLYGGFSQYNRLNYWRKCKSSEGTIKLEPSEDVYKQVRDWYKKKYPEKYKAVIIKSHPKAHVLSLIYKELEIKVPKNNAPRGVYFCSLYDNSLEFLRKETDELSGKKFDNSVKSLTELWKTKYAEKRIAQLTKEKKTKDEILFYDKLIGLLWEETKEKHLED